MLLVPPAHPAGLARHPPAYDDGFRGVARTRHSQIFWGCRCRPALKIQPNSSTTKAQAARDLTRCVSMASCDIGTNMAPLTPKTSVVATRAKNAPPNAHEIHVRPARWAIQPNQTAVASANNQGTFIFSLAPSYRFPRACKPATECGRPRPQQVPNFDDVRKNRMPPRIPRCCARDGRTPGKHRDTADRFLIPRRAQAFPCAIRCFARRRGQSAKSSLRRRACPALAGRWAASAHR
jgi:hypothetical protein